MKPNSIDDLINEVETTDVPSPAEDARAQAIAKANQTFDQAFQTNARPKTTQSNSVLRRFIMSVFSKTPISNGVAYTIGAVAVVGIALPILVSYNSGPSPVALPQAQTEVRLDNSSTVVSRNEEDRTATKPDFTTLEKEIAEMAGEISVTTESSQATPESIVLEEVTVSASKTIAPSESPNGFNDTNVVPKKTKRVEALREIIKRETPLMKRHPAKQSTDGVIRSAKVESKVRLTSSSFNAAIGSMKIPEPELAPAPGSVRPDLDEEYPEYQRSGITQVNDEPISTFSADVDTASYSLVRNQINRGFMPAHHAVRAEELINYFDYNYPQAESKSQPFMPTISVADSPWNKGRKLVHIGIKGYDISRDQMPDSNIVFLIDVSGSMNDANKLPLAKQSIKFLADQLNATDNISIAVYAGAAGVVLEPTEAKNKSKISEALSKLSAGGSTAGGAGIELAYNLAQQNFDKDAVNRVVILTDGDFNVGQSSNQALKELVERKRESGVFLSVLGFGRNNYQDDMMQTLAQNGNGIAAYIDTLSEAKKVFVDEATSSLFPIAKDVKFQVEFNPATVSDYRLIGYETRALNTEDFNNDKVDAGDIGAGHTVTAIYEITPVGSDTPTVDKPRYAANTKPASTGSKTEYGFLKMRYKLPNEDTSKLIETPIKINASAPSEDAQFSIAVASFAQLLNGDTNIGDLDFEATSKMAKANKGKDNFGYRSEFIQLVEMAGLIE